MPSTLYNVQLSSIQNWLHAIKYPGNNYHHVLMKTALASSHIFIEDTDKPSLPEEIYLKAY